MFLDKDGTAVWGVAALLAEAVIKEGVCAYAYADIPAKLLYNPKCTRVYACRCKTSSTASTLWRCGSMHRLSRRGA